MFAGPIRELYLKEVQYRRAKNYKNFASIPLLNSFTPYIVLVATEKNKFILYFAI